MSRWLASVVLLLGCASRESPGRPDAGGDTSVVVDVGDASKVPDGAAAALARNHGVFCKSFKACFPIEFSTLYKDEETCVARRLTFSLSVLFGPGSLLTTADIEACGRASGESYTCDEILRIFGENPVTPADCRLKGTLPNGARCAASDQCKSGFCRYEVNGACGTCADRAAPGAPCGMHVHCAEGFACQGGKCVAWVDRDGACDATKPCHRVDVCSDGKCVKRLPLGSDCDDVKQDCEVNASCNTVTKKCEPLVSSGLGARCGYLESGALGLCNFGLKCKITDPVTYTGACVGAAKLGESCFRSGPTGSQCETPLLCAGGVCVLPSTESCR